ncbi:metallophosphoesterase [Sphingobacterium phlebotomi]|uniref:Metallophosphoesterase n=1 Tax=Sphingobacterium phlebotomi TaxID=2605433 RepID=A0A5D4H9V8_9SPHI|nr:calcineurin-like phosphoesterase family protein [Sphingobacterium phlebotomi]TYR36619.1 metallophosphoesterase [Sphingobacterium phlebotomi]
MKKTDTFTRRAFIGGTVVTGLGLTLNLISCEKSTETPEPPQPDPTTSGNENTLNITDVSLPSNIDVSKGMELTITGKGFAMGDQVIFDPLIAGYPRAAIDVSRVSAESVVIVLAEQLVTSGYRVSVKRGSRTVTLGQTALNFVFNASIPDKDGMTIKGTVFADGVGLANVVVSDGFEVTATDENGIYYLPSAKKTKYVFVSIPGNYEVATDINAPLFFNRLRQPEETVETHDFELTPVNNNKHVVMVLGDMHLANRNNDISQFQTGFLTDVNQSIQKYKNAGNKVYALTLGDMSWDTYWLLTNYGLPDYLREMNKINAPVFNTMGNHDNNPSHTDDWISEDKFREVIGPTYYSFNIGKVHYIVLDNIEFKENNGARAYSPRIVSDQLEWLKKDLATVTDKTTPIVIAMHVQLISNLSLNGSGQESRVFRLQESQLFVNALSGFTDVNILSGHVHANYNVRLSPSIMEHNTGAVCATWWWTGRDGHAGNHICKDGTPGGYAIWEMEDRQLKWTYKSIGYEEDYQFRAYDLNKVHLTEDKYVPLHNPSTTGVSWNTYAGEYVNLNQNNEILINVWNYDTDWTVEVTENGVSLPITRVHVTDPLHIISYSAQRMNRNAAPTGAFVSIPTAHMFKVQASSPTSTVEIKVTDCFGRIFQESMVRPKEIHTQMK